MPDACELKPAGSNPRSNLLVSRGEVQCQRITGNHAQRILLGHVFTAASIYKMSVLHSTEFS